MGKKKPNKKIGSRFTDILGKVREITDTFSDLRPGQIEREIELIAERLSTLARRGPSVSTEKSKVKKGKKRDLPDPLEGATAVERLINNSNLLPISFLEQGVQAQRAVARVVLTQPHGGLPAGSGWATGFLVAPSLFLTNNHVIENSAFLSKIRIQFNFQDAPGGIDRVPEDFFPDENGTFHTKESLDYTLIRLRMRQFPTGTQPVTAGQHWGTISLNPNPIFFAGQRLNIVQHPDGRQKEIALQDNEIDRLFQNVVRYKADTEPGSSGSPVFDNFWRLVALHHSAGEQAADGTWINNQGIRVDRIVADLRTKFSAGAQQGVLSELGI